ncbi:PREDICTED: NADH dehydrogenase [ubiquinone] 1 beta subcomplex subunit 2, mitochondrial isoform X2 [Cercocebus atys]|uniref:NADH dehydrogenase [ubiquinone] 1 beta subcomplex subunit 2, mitochondrial isoform X2 n=1 Tax=Cercocebus atys TaxID=9531 RepID=UPI0005F5788E|nr:PREDICTED: NADH dehydrogenase [ubiquinone] 1 beta subcomplex subunit 2, mitochondrial isoform X2 [Cercocebus atys]XP_025234582.1 NADH dehydrogenase [ubiquinone] 1 beta subcomplex subunit 2, mitochondrial isoform X2 [Theropithecus gelada]
MESHERRPLVLREEMGGCCSSLSAGGGVHIEPRYRQFPQLTRSQVFQGELYSGFMWFWILWRFWHDSEDVLGHFPYPDPFQWTDEELGIPPDDED